MAVLLSSMANLKEKDRQQPGLSDYANEIDSDSPSSDDAFTALITEGAELSGFICMLKFLAVYILTSLTLALYRSPT